MFRIMSKSMRFTICFTNLGGGARGVIVSKSPFMEPLGLLLLLRPFSPWTTDERGDWAFFRLATSR